MPITPPPTTTSARGRCGSFRMPSESSTVESSNSTVFGRFGRVPTAITMLSAVIRRSSLPAVDGDRVRVDEARVAVQHLHVVARQLVAHHVDLALDDGLRAPEEVLDRDVVLHLVALPVQLLLGHAGQVDHGLAQRLGRQRAGVGAHPADHVPPLDDGDALAELRGLDRGLLSGRAGTDHQQVEVARGGSGRLGCAPGVCVRATQSLSAARSRGLTGFGGGRC